MAFGFLNGDYIFLFAIIAGIIQGCPLAGTTFALDADPFLEHFRRIIYYTGKGIVRACADDIGMALKDHDTLR